MSVSGVRMRLEHNLAIRCDHSVVATERCALTSGGLSPGPSWAPACPHLRPTAHATPLTRLRAHMTRTHIAILVTLATLTSACVTLPDTDPIRSDSRDTAAATPAPNWVVQRAALSAALSQLAEIEAHDMDDGHLLVRLPAAHGFAPNSNTPAPSLLGLLDQVIPLLRAYSDNDVLILGHTDSIGSEVHNLGLSIQRAEAVMDYLMAQGISLGRLKADGRGESQPIADNGAEQGRAHNRRVELILSPHPQ